MRMPRQGGETLPTAAASTLSLEKLIALLEAGTINERTLLMLMQLLPVVSQEPDEEDEEADEGGEGREAVKEVSLPDGVAACSATCSIACICARKYATSLAGKCHFAGESLAYASCR